MYLKKEGGRRNREIQSLVGKLWEFGSWRKKPVLEVYIWRLELIRLCDIKAPQLHISRCFFSLDTSDQINLYYTLAAATKSRY